MLSSIGWWSLYIVLALGAVWFIVNIVYAIAFIRFVSCLPPMIWMNLQTVQEKTEYGEFLSSSFLDDLNEFGELRIRQREGLSKVGKIIAENGFSADYACYFEYQYAPPGPRKRRPRFKTIGGFAPIFVPAR